MNNGAPLATILLSIYDLLWRAALPFLRSKPRLKLGWEERTLHKSISGPFDLWIQAASGGESMLSVLVLQQLANQLEPSEKLKILATSGTQQGIDSLTRGLSGLEAEQIELTICFFPFDAPHLMKKAFARFQPGLIVTVETEMWPAQLILAKRNSIPVLLINGRISDKSVGAYRRFRPFFKRWGPDMVWAISSIDRERFGAILGEEKVELMNNIKFDRIIPRDVSDTVNPLTAIVSRGYPFVLLGSVRQEEEQQILTVITQLFHARKDIVIGLFPKHIERADHWLETLAHEQIPAVKRSVINTVQPPGTVIVWDTFGELAGAYGLASACFVGGSLAKLGGQNFLEPLVFGLRPIIGPHWTNFAWVGREIITSGLVIEVQSPNDLGKQLLTSLDRQESRVDIREKVRAYLEPRQGGTRYIAHTLYAHLSKNREHEK